jgi:hypothetical protein
MPGQSVLFKLNLDFCQISFIDHILFRFTSELSNLMNRGWQTLSEYVVNKIIKYCFYCVFKFITCGMLQKSTLFYDVMSCRQIRHVSSYGEVINNRKMR